ncbi:hypothetical protein AB0I28_12430 [Phytomonospora sp. NPDC050363]|uniref:hypothetical protein n=1 Tax=Phytomonospora sp. NPDC050363 TaxID=3155642 RepID=UPI0033C07CD7
MDPMTRLTRDEYMDLLLARQAEWVAANPLEEAAAATIARIKAEYPDANPQINLRHRPPLLEWFICEGDENLVDIAFLEPEPQPKRDRKPRVYRSAVSLRDERNRVQAQMDAITGDDCGDMAVVNLSPNARSRAARRAGVRRFAKLDRDLQRFTELKRRLDRLNGRIAAAEARESTTTDSAQTCPEWTAR